MVLHRVLLAAVGLLVGLLASTSLRVADVAASPLPSTSPTPVTAPRTPITGTIRATVQPLPSGGGSVTAVSFADPRHGWLVAGDTLLATSDGGATWQPRYQGKVGVLTMLDARRGWALDRHTLRFTPDGGRQWARRREGVRSVARAPDVAHGLWVVADDGVWRTDDDGATWERRGGQAFTKLAFGDEREGWASEPFADRYGEFAGVRLWRSRDGGRTWIQRPTPCSYREATVAFGFAAPREGWLLCVVSVPEFHWSPKQLFVTDDGGDHWRLVADTPQYDRTAPFRFDTLPHGSLTGIVFRTREHGWLTTGGREGGGVAETRDGGQTWARVSASIDTIDTEESDPTPLGPRSGVAQRFDQMSGTWVLVSTDDGGASWRQRYPPMAPQGPVRFANRRGGWGFAPFLMAGGVLRTDDGGRSWRVVGSLGQPCRRASDITVRTLHIKPRDQLWVTAWCSKSSAVPGAWKLLRSWSAGARWKTVGEAATLMDIERQLPAAGSAAQWRISGESPDGVLEQSAEGGATWATLLAGYGVESFSLVDSQHGWVVAGHATSAGYDRQLLTTEDGGKRWMRVVGVSGVGVQFVDVRHGWLRDGASLWSTSDGGASWQQLQ